MNFNTQNYITFQEALVLGIFDSNVALITSHPGYPVTSIFEKLSKFIEKKNTKKIKVEWCINEVIALENAMGASFSGARSLVIMKNHGTNTVLDVLTNFSYIGVRGGILLISADDIGVKASHNESDSRLYGLVTKIPVLEPSDVEEAYKFVPLGFKLSESYDTPVILRITSNQLNLKDKSISIKQNNIKEKVDYQFLPDKKKFYIGPRNYSRMKGAIIKRIQNIKRESQIEFNKLYRGNKDIGIICSGDTFNKVKNAFPHATILKLGLTYPVSEPDLKTFFQYLSQARKVYIVEQNEPLIEIQVKNFLYESFTNKLQYHNGILNQLEIIGKNRFSEIGEIEESDLKKIILNIEDNKPINNINSIDLISKKVTDSKNNSLQIQLCPACPARCVLISLKLLNIKVMGDAGCTALGCLPPFESVHSGTCMGASIATAAGVNKVSKEKVVSLIGDSAFFHNGFLGLLNEVGSKSELFVIIFNNKNAALTGGQITFKGTQMGKQSSEKIKKIFHNLGINEHNISILKEVFNLKRVKEEIAKFYYQLKGIRILIIDGICNYNFQDFYGKQISEKNGAIKILEGKMLNPGCYAWSKVSQDRYQINQDLCRGCTLCEELVKNG